MPKRLWVRAALATALATSLMTAVIGVANHGSARGAGLTAGTQSTTDPLHGWRPPRNLEWKACAANTDAQCTEIQVPANWADPGGPKTNLRIGKAAATNPAKRIGTLFMPASPQGIRSYVIGKALPNFAKLQEQFDMVSIDARSHTVVCNQDLLALSDFQPYPDTKALWDQLLASNAARSKDCRARSGPVFDNEDALTEAADWEATRLALAEPKLTLYSAGTYTLAGKEYARLFPNRLRAAVFDSLWDHSETSAKRYITDFTAAQETRFNDFVAWCGEKTACALNGQDVTKIWETLYAAAQKGQLINPQTGEVIRPDTLQFNLYINLFEPDPGWTATAQDWKTMYSWLNTPATAPKTAAKAASPAATEPAIGHLDDYSLQGPQCEDLRFDVNGPGEMAEFRALMAQLAPHTKILGSINWNRIVQCEDWQAAASFPQRSEMVSGTPTLLVLVGRHDESVPYAWATKSASEFKNAVTLEFAGGAYPYYYGGACVQQKVLNYLFTAKPPAKGTTCPDVTPGDPAAQAAATPGSLILGPTGSPRRGPLRVTQ